MNFIGYLVINTVQLGATIDYGILLTTHYLRHRRRVPARKAAHLALGETFPSLLVSAGILATAGFALGFSSSMSAVSSLGFLLARGALLSLTLVTCFLPALLSGAPPGMRTSRLSRLPSPRCPQRLRLSTPHLP